LLPIAGNGGLNHQSANDHLLTSPDHRPLPADSVEKLGFERGLLGAWMEAIGGIVELSPLFRALCGCWFWTFGHRHQPFRHSS
jgi:hypothetical protein